MVDPDARALEVVTGGDVRRTLSDHEVEPGRARDAVAFADGDLVGGLKRGIEMLAEHARPPDPARRHGVHVRCAVVEAARRSRPRPASGGPAPWSRGRRGQASASLACAASARATSARPSRT